MTAVCMGLWQICHCRALAHTCQISRHNRLHTMFCLYGKRRRHSAVGKHLQLFCRSCALPFVTCNHWLTPHKQLAEVCVQMNQGTCSCVLFKYLFQSAYNSGRCRPVGVVKRPQINMTSCC